MTKTITLEMELPSECNSCEFLRTIDFWMDNYCILSREFLGEVCGSIDENCPFLKENSVVKIPNRKKG